MSPLPATAGLAMMAARAGGMFPPGATWKTGVVHGMERMYPAVFAAYGPGLPPEFDVNIHPTYVETYRALGLR